MLIFEGFYLHSLINKDQDKYSFINILIHMTRNVLYKGISDL
jgi:hypothetical protein